MITDFSITRPKRQQAISATLLALAATGGGAFQVMPWITQPFTTKQPLTKYDFEAIEKARIKRERKKK